MQLRCAAVSSRAAVSRAATAQLWRVDLLAELDGVESDLERFGKGGAPESEMQSRILLSCPWSPVRDADSLGGEILKELFLVHAGPQQEAARYRQHCQEHLADQLPDVGRDGGRVHRLEK